jgi:hypothetical protein
MWSERAATAGHFVWTITIAAMSTKVIAESLSAQPAIRTRAGEFRRGDFGQYRTTPMFGGVW